MPQPPKNLRSEILAVEEGHHAFFIPGTNQRRQVGAYTVKSDRTSHRFVVRVHQLISGSVHFECNHSTVLGFQDRSVVGRPGVVPCKHAALVARRLERERAIELVEDRWVIRRG